MTKEEVESFVEAASKNGTIFCSKETYKAIRALFQPTDSDSEIFGGIKIVVSEHIPPNRLLTLPLGQVPDRVDAILYAMEGDSFVR